MEQKYKIIKKIGGKQCQIYQAIRKMDGKQVAIKKISYANMGSKRKHQLVQQINSLSQIKSNHVVKYYQHFIHKNQLVLYVIMELCKGDTLETYLAQYKLKGQLLQQNIIWNIFMQIVLALNDIHHSLKAKILHRNLKPSNIFGEFYQNVKIGDFGLLRKLNPEENFSSTLLEDSFYLSPQQLEKGVFTMKTDIWALGCLLYQMATLKHPFEGTNQFQIAKKIRDGKPDPINFGYSKQLSRVIQLCLRKNPQQRPTANDLLYIPQINYRLRQNRNIENINRLKNRQKQLIEKQNQLLKLEKQINQLLINKKNDQKNILELKKTLSKESQKSTERYSPQIFIPMVSSQWYSVKK